MEQLVFAVDFDGTIVEHMFPAIGEPLPQAFDTMKALQERGHKIIIWTCRAGDNLAEMIQYFKSVGFQPDAINSNLYHTPGFAMPKILATHYLDDRNFPPFPGWHVVAETFLK